MNQPIKLYQSLYILQKCNVVLQRVVSRTRSTVDGKLDLIADDEFLVDNTMLIILQLTIFLDEYEKHFHRVELGYQQRVIIFKKIVSPIINQIKMCTVMDKLFAPLCLFSSERNLLCVTLLQSFPRFLHIG